MHFSARSLALTALCFGTTLGHMMISSPVPFGKATLNNSPLNNAKPGTSQSDYPCKQRTGVYQLDTMNKMAVGQAQELNFTGSASHGGGTCQLSVSLDHEPNAKSTFKVIQTYEGGCPTANDGNSGSHPFTFEIPKGFPNGQATLAWTWYNKIGNREIYMNCAPIEVSGGADNNDLYDTLPNMYLINLPTSECASADSKDVLVPSPGEYVLKDSSASLAAPSGPSCAASAAAITQGVKDYQSATSNDGAAYSAPANAGAQAAAPASSDAQATSAAAGSASTAPSTLVTSAVASSTAAVESAASTAPASNAAPESNQSSAQDSSFPTMTVSSGDGVSGPASTGLAAAPPGTSSSSGSGSGTCSSDGELVCNGADQFGLCDNGKVVWQQVATGTTCSNGQIQKRSEVRHAHVRRHAQNVKKGF